MASRYWPSAPPLVQCRDALANAGIQQGLVERLRGFGRWEDHVQEWWHWAQTCLDVGERPYVVRPQHYVNSSSTWTPWDSDLCDADLALHTPRLLHSLQGFALSDCKEECEHWQALQNQEHSAFTVCRSVLYDDTASECWLFSAGCWVPDGMTDRGVLHVHIMPADVGAAAVSGEYHWTDFGVCLPPPCFGAEAEDTAIWLSRGLMSRPVFRWWVREVSVANSDVSIGHQEGDMRSHISDAVTLHQVEEAKTSYSHAFMRRQSELFVTPGKYALGANPVAVCIEGPAYAVDSNTLESQLRHLVEATGAVVVAHVEAVAQAACDLSEQIFRAVFGGRLVRFNCAIDVDEHALLVTFFEEVQDAARRRGDAPEEVLRWSSLWLNSIQEGLFSVAEQGKGVDNSVRMFLRLLRNVMAKEACRAQIIEAEKSLGAVRTIVYNRVDDYYLVHYPPLVLFAAEGVWIPEGDDWGGWDDRHACGDRKSMLTYFSRYKHMVSGGLLTAIYLDREKRHSWSHKQHVVNPERLLQLHLNSFGIEVHRFLPVSSRRCSSVYGDRSRPCAIKSIVFGARGFRDPYTLTDAYNTASAILLHSYRWFLTVRARPLQPSCHDWYQHGGGANRLKYAQGHLRPGYLLQNLSLDLCCNELLFGAGGMHWCWQEPFYDFSRCCTRTFRVSVGLAGIASATACWDGTVDGQTAIRTCV